MNGIDEDWQMGGGACLEEVVHGGHILGRLPYLAHFPYFFSLLPGHHDASFSPFLHYYTISTANYSLQSWAKITCPLDCFCQEHNHSDTRVTDTQAVADPDMCSRRSLSPLNLPLHLICLESAEWGAFCFPPVMRTSFFCLLPCQILVHLQMRLMR